jgi:methionyl-tRNA synthetase
VVKVTAKKKTKPEKAEKHIRTHKQILITSALPYVNNVPHLGNLVCVLSANVYDRFLKLKQENVLSVLGTDENGTTTETKAYEMGITPQECVDHFFKIHKEVYEWFGCIFDCFGRTSSKENHEISKDIFLKLYKHGFIVEKEIEQLYSPKEDRYLADRFVEGICPNCQYPKARGDQCDKCGKLLNATELINPVSKISGDTPIIRKTRHLFIDLPKLEPELKKWIASVEGNWTENAKTTTHAWIKEGLRERDITRDIKWGIPVPIKGYEDKVLYSWFDAPIGYISITKEARKDWEDWWKNDKTQLVQFMGKDNIPFHTILFPAFLIGARDNYILVDRLAVNEYLNYEDGKFSKSLGQGIFGDDAIKTGIPADVWRYYLIINHPETNDTYFTWENFQERINNELVANIGNLVNRTLQFVNRYYDSKVPEIALHFDYKDAFADVEKCYEEIKLKDALKAILHVSKKANGYFQEQEPWKAVKENKEKADNAIANLVQFIKDLSIIIEPILPNTAKNIRKQLNVQEQLFWDDLFKPMPAGHAIGKAEILFNKLEDDQIAAFKKKFAGRQDSAKPEKPTTSTKSAHGEHVEQSTNADFSILDLKVALVKEIKPHPEAEKLYILQLDLGNEQRQLVAGLRPYYKEDELLGKRIVIITNLEHAKLRGQLSQGMLLAAEDEMHTVGILFTEKSAPGEQVFIDGIIPQHKQISFKEFQTLKIYAEHGHVYCNGKQLKTKHEAIKVEKVKNGSVR